MRSGSSAATFSARPSSPRGATHLRLREATAAIHQRLEADLDLLDPNLTIDRYRAIVRAFYGYYEPLERSVFAAASAELADGFVLVPRARLLADDLVALGERRERLGELPRCRDLPKIECVADVAGCLYVLEGAALGGQVISRALERRFGMRARRWSSFFIGSGAGTASRWKHVLAWVEDVAATEHRREVAVAAACETFATFARWVERETRPM